MRPMQSPSRFVGRPVSRKEGIIKICAWCSKDQVNLDELPPLSVSHTICAECAKALIDQMRQDAAMLRKKHP